MSIKVNSLRITILGAFVLTATFLVASGYFGGNGEGSIINVAKGDREAKAGVVNGKIVFQSNRDGNTEIYVMDADGSNQTRITNNTVPDVQPRWSPDGTKIAFSSVRAPSGQEIWVMNADGTGQTQLTTAAGLDSTPAWSPDGTKIAYSAVGAGGFNLDVFVMNADGTNVVNLTNDFGGDSSPFWSPDGTKIAFDSTRAGNSEIFIMNADGTNPVNITNSTPLEIQPNWSSDGAKITFARLDGNFQIYTANPDGTGATPLTVSPEAGFNSEFSPNSAKIAYTRPNAGANQIYVMDANGSNKAPLTNNAGVVDQYPDWKVAPAATPTPTPTPCVSAPAGRVSQWKGEGNANDSLGTNNATLQSGATFTAGKVGQAFDLPNGTNAYLRVPDSSTLKLQQFTVEAWVKETNSSGTSCIFCKGSLTGTNNSYALTYGAGGLFFSTHNDSTSIGTAVANTSIWHHVAGTFDGSSQKVYLDGVLVASGVNASPIIYEPGSIPLTIGADLTAGSANHFFEGQIDEPAFYNRALSEAEIQSVFNAGGGGTCACVPQVNGKVLWHRADGNTLDSSGNPNNGTFVGGATFSDGKVRQGYIFNGTGYVRVPDSNSLDVTTQFTMDAWINPSISHNGVPQGGIISKIGGSGGNNGYQFVLNGNNTTLECMFNASGEPWPQNKLVATVPGGVPINAWSHAACTYDNSDLKIYFNGTLVGTLNVGPKTVINSSSALRVGSDENNNVFFTGRIDEAEVYNRALSQSEIQSIINADIGGQCSGSCPVTPAENKISWWRAEGNPSTNHGSLVGGTTYVSGQSGQAFNLNGTNAGVTIPHNTNLNVNAGGFSADFWMKSNANPGGQVLLIDKSHGFTDSTGWAFQSNPSGNNLSFFIGAGGGGSTNFVGVDSTVNPFDGNFHHIAGTWDGFNVRLYIDGVLQGTTVLTSPVNNSRPVNIGYAWGGGSPQRFFNGVIDEAAVYGRSLTAAEIRAAAGVCAFAPCSGGWVPGEWQFFNGHYYSVQGITGTASWMAARSQARELTAPNGARVDLASITSGPENTFIFNGINCPDYWGLDPAGNNQGPNIGGYQFNKLSEPAGNWIWVSGEQFTFTSWNPGEPNNSSGVEDMATYFATGSGRSSNWNDIGKGTPTVINYYIAESSDPQACTTAPPQMVSWWKAEDTPLDSMITANHGTMQGAGFGTGFVNRAFTFDGVDDYVSIPDAPSLRFGPASPMSVDLWVLRTTTGPQHFIGKRDSCSGGVNGYQMGVDVVVNQGCGLFFGAAGGGVCSGVDLPMNTWTHLTGTFDGVTTRMYMNGVPIAEGNTPLGPVNNAPLLIGATSTTCSPFYSTGGRIDEVEIFNRALTPAEISSIVIAGPSGKCPLTASGVTVSGRVLASLDGRGVTNARVTLTDLEGRTRSVITGRLGRYLFENVETGKAYIISVRSRRFNYVPRTISVFENLEDIDFVPEE